MKQYKIYTKGNYIVIVDVQKDEYFYGIRKEVHIDKSNVNKAIYKAFNVKDFSSSIILAVPNILKEDGTPYSEAEFDTFYQENTGNFNGGGSAPTVLSVTGNLVDNTDPLNPVIDRGYKVFKAIVTAPFHTENITVMDILYNDVYTGTAVWSRLNTGIYVLTLNGAFSGNIFTNGRISTTNDNQNTDITYISKYTNNEIYLYNFNSSGTRVDLTTDNKYPLYFEIHP